LNSKFFTNRDENTLENRLKDILKNHDIKFLEFLIGYFRISGFSKIAKLLDGIEKTRILVGINVDKLVYEAKTRGKERSLFNSEKVKNEFIENQKNILENQKETPYNQEVDESVEVLAKMIADKRLEIRISQHKDIHSKIYILRQKEVKRHDGSIEQIGSVITGSSNLTDNGLRNNFEFNVELRDSDDIAFALNEFETLWDNAVELEEIDIVELKSRTYLKEITPYELYLKFLIEYFDDRIEYDSNLLWKLPKNFMKLAYQLDAVNEGISKIKKHNGFFLADVVGLGKTVTTAMIVKKLLFDLKGEVLVITPPSVQKEWKETFKKFEIGSFGNYEIVSLGMLDKIKDVSNYELIIIDESHKFKNYATGRYKELERICKEQSKHKKKVILISATPLNNRTMDIANQLYLFQDKRNSTIPSYPNLESFFGKVEKEYKEIIGHGNELNEIQKEKLKKLSQKIRDNILREVMVRRTRTDILNHDMYKKDLEEQGLTIPEVKPVKEIKYYMDDELVKIFDKTVDILIHKLQYERYKILWYLRPQARKKFGKISENIFEKGALQLAGLMKNLLVKRFESSFYAFKLSIKKLEKHLSGLIDMFENNDIIIGSDMNIFDILESDDADEKIETLLEKGKAKRFSRDDFRDDYLSKLKEELKIIKKLNELWQVIKEDPKLEKFKEILSQNKNKKIVVFTESKDTAIYLADKLKEKFRILCVYGDNRDRLKNVIRENFDANYSKQKNEYDIIITTDTLSEGVNLHRSNIIYNYDIPWNSTRLMQRIGRINRIGTKHKEIFIYNFIPSARSDALIELSKKAFIKLQTFHSTLGEDNQIYSKEEEVGSVELFEYMKDEIDEELKYLEEIRNFKKSNPLKFNKIRNLPAKIRVQRNNEKLQNSTFVFIKNDNSKSYYLVTDNNCKAVNFLEMAKYLKANPKEKPVLPIKSIHYKHVGKALENYEKELKNIAVNKQIIKINNATDKKALRLLKGWRDKGYIDVKRYKIFKSLFETGRYQNLGREIIKISKLPLNEINNKLEEIERIYNIQEEQNFEKRVSFNTEIILSETFI
jgi:superfamily II DNA or RNA helicase